MKKSGLKITRRKLVYYNKSRDLKCVTCGKDLKDSWIVSQRHKKHRCVNCAVKVHILDDYPEFIDVKEV
jgi:DNA-directed RNA polymerase subunit RPC12/RpoP